MPDNLAGLWHLSGGDDDIGNNYLFSVYASTDHPGAWMGANVNGTNANVQPIAVGGYQNYTIGFLAPHAGDVIRVWIYAPAAAGLVVVDDATLSVDTGPR